MSPLPQEHRCWCRAKTVGFGRTHVIQTGAYIRIIRYQLVDYEWAAIKPMFCRHQCLALLLEDLTVRCSVLTIRGKASMLARVLSVRELSAFAPLLGRERTSVKPTDL
jgi:hypothetical protein